MAATSRASVHIEGLEQVQKALRKLPRDATDELKKGTRKLSKTLTRDARDGGKGDTPQSSRAAQTVRTLDGAAQGVQAGPHPLLLGSEFGATARFGWYAAGRYRHSTARQFRPHLGGGSYWFFKTAEDSPEIGEQWRQMADAIIDRWGA